MKKPIINVKDAKTMEGGNGDHFAYRFTDLSRAVGSQALGANITRVPPGKTAFPFHHHHGNEEHFFVLSGTGTLRSGDELHPVVPEDYIVCLSGGAETAHQLINTGGEDLVYLAISTQNVPEVVGYPDSGKTGVRTDAANRFLVPDSAQSSDYWAGEDGARVAEIVADNPDKGDR